jgi:hypothetical protein
MKPTDLIKGLDIHPFSRTIWNSPEAQEQWGPILKRAYRLHDTLEYEMVKQGLRKCATLHISPRNYDKTVEKIFLDNLVWLPIQRSRSYTGFSHTHFPVKELDANSTVYGVLARKIEDAEAFRAASMSGSTDHLKIGELLGFPKCCSKKFVEWWAEGYFDPVYQSAVSTLSAYRNEDGSITVEPHVAAQQMLRYTGYRLTSHFPCSLQCAESIKVGKVWYDLGKEVDPQGLEALMQILSLPGEWSVSHGIAVIETLPFTIVTNSLPTKRKWVVKWDKVLGY